MCNLINLTRFFIEIIYLLIIKTFDDAFKLIIFFK